MAKRHKMSAHHSRANFRRGSRVKGKNMLGTPMRGGIRL